MDLTLYLDRVPGVLDSSAERELRGVERFVWQLSRKIAWHPEINNEHMFHKVELVVTGNSLRIGISGWPFRHWDVESVFRKITREYGLGYLDFWPESRQGQSLEDTRKLAKEYGVVLYCANVSSARRLGGRGSQLEAIEAIRLAIQEAADLGIPCVQFYGSGEGVNDVWITVNRVWRALQPLLEFAERRDVILFFENDYDESGLDAQGTALKRKPEVIHALMTLVNSPQLRFTYDPCNFYIAGEEAYPYAYELLAPYIANVHLKDAVRYSPLLHADDFANRRTTTDTVRGAYLAVPCGLGAVNLDGLLRRLAVDAYQGYLTLDSYCTGELADEYFLRDLEYLRPYFELMSGK